MSRHNISRMGRELLSGNTLFLRIDYKFVEAVKIEANFLKGGKKGGGGGGGEDKEA